jgi:quinol monooxygenase YgiN
MFAVCVSFDIHRQWCDAFLERMREQARTSLDLEPGCLRFDVWSDSDSPTTVFLYEIYADAAAFDAAVAGMVAAKSVVTYDRPFAS